MFTGIVTDVGTVQSVEGEGDVRLKLSTSYDTSGIDIGASIACSGVCLTVVTKGDNFFSADVSRETTSVTNLGAWEKGTEVNLERSLKVGDELGGHIVTGHVDCVGEIVTFESVDESILLQILVPEAFGHNVAKKGSITINGVSLTVNEVEDLEDSTKVSINVIPHTQEVTNFRQAQVGDKVNVEFDILARYVARLQDKG
ncbi:riboflavin synthase [Kordiimonas sp. SCSIO 12603]|uniref:riboflavin synthase n=1 Tax=Kordiimonas sp. SCSIO 12603 TaxID=2829596 RepID=UPI002103DBFC|nr:riboflavin synthase [Kordiimonas sp. SCSIO 12603]UTW57552.1 riboflavin synthase [Kordiimonas sp. SCSIO 12603]